MRGAKRVNRISYIPAGPLYGRCCRDGGGMPLLQTGRRPAKKGARRQPGPWVFFKNIVGFLILGEESAFLQFAGSFADLETIMIDLDLVTSFFENAVLLPCELNSLGLTRFEVYRYLGSVHLVAFVTAGECA